MAYSIDIAEHAQRQLRKLEKSVQKRIANAIKGLEDNPRPNGCKKLKGRPAYRIREGEYRIIYEIEDKVLVITIIEIGHRREVYD